MTEPTPLVATLIDLLRERDGRRTIVVTAGGNRLVVHNIAWGYDMGDEFAHVTTNISPNVEPASVDFFFTHDVRDVLDEHEQPIEIDLHGIGRADALNGQLLPIVEDEDAGTVTIGSTVIQGWLDESQCDRCGAEIIMDESNDAKLCPQCNRWLESKCDDPACEYCPHRPDQPMSRA